MSDDADKVENCGQPTDQIQPKPVAGMVGGDQRAAEGTTPGTSARGSKGGKVAGSPSPDPTQVLTPTPSTGRVSLFEPEKKGDGGQGKGGSETGANRGDGARNQGAYDFENTSRALKRIGWSTWARRRLAPILDAGAALLAEGVVVLNGRGLDGSLEPLIDGIVAQGRAGLGGSGLRLQDMRVNWGLSDDDVRSFFDEERDTGCDGDPRVFFDFRPIDPAKPAGLRLLERLEDPAFRSALRERGSRLVLIQTSDEAAPRLRTDERAAAHAALTLEVPWLVLWLERHVSAETIGPALADELLAEGERHFRDAPALERRFHARIWRTTAYDDLLPQAFAETFRADLAGAPGGEGRAVLDSSIDEAKVFADPLDSTLVTLVAFAPDLPDPVFHDLVDIALPSRPLAYEEMSRKQKAAWTVAGESGGERPVYTWIDRWREDPDERRNRLGIVVVEDKGERRVRLDSRRWNEEATRVRLASTRPAAVRRLIDDLTGLFTADTVPEEEEGEPRVAPKNLPAAKAVARIAVAAGARVGRTEADLVADWLYRLSCPADKDVETHAKNLTEVLKVAVQELRRSGEAVTGLPSERDLLGALVRRCRHEAEQTLRLARTLVRLDEGTAGDRDLFDRHLRVLIEQTTGKGRKLLAETAAFLLDGLGAGRKATLVPMLIEMLGGAGRLVRFAEETREWTALRLLAAALHSEIPLWAPYDLPLPKTRADLFRSSLASFVFEEADDALVRRLVAALVAFDPALWPLNGVPAMARLHDLWFSLQSGLPKDHFEAHARALDGFDTVFGRRFTETLVDVAQAHMASEKVTFVVGAEAALYGAAALAAEVAGGRSDLDADARRRFTETLVDVAQAHMASQKVDFVPATEAALSGAAALAARAATAGGRADLDADARRQIARILLPLRLFVPLILAEWRFLRFGPFNDGLGAEDRKGLHRLIDLVAEAPAPRVEAIADGWERLAAFCDGQAEASRILGADAAARVFDGKARRFANMAASLRKRRNDPDRPTNAPIRPE